VLKLQTTDDLASGFPLREEASITEPAQIIVEGALRNCDLDGLL
jgi:hypothetical protein